MHKVLNYDVVQFVYFLLPLFVMSNKEVIAESNVMKLFCHFLKKSFLVLALIFRFILSELIFVYGMIKGSKFVFSYVDIQLSQHYLFKRLFFLR